MSQPFRIKNDLEITGSLFAHSSELGGSVPAEPIGQPFRTSGDAETEVDFQTAGALSVGPVFDPAVSLFSADEPGFLFLANPETCFTDTAGTTNAGPGEPVALWLDQSGNDNHATQPTTANRPILGRKPEGGRRNLLRYTEELENSVWSKTDVTVEDNVGTVMGIPYSRITPVSGEVVPIVAIGGGAFVRNIQQILVKADGFDFVIVGTATSTPGRNLAVDLQTGAQTEVSSAQNGDILERIEPVGDGWFRVTKYNAAGSVTAGGTFEIRPKETLNNNRDATVNGDGVKSILVAAPHSEIVADAPSSPVPAVAYQRVTDRFDVTEAGAPDRHYLFFGGDADPKFMQTPTITPGTDKVQMFAGVRKLSDTEGWVVVYNSNNADGSFSLRLPRVTSPAGIDGWAVRRSNSIRLDTPNRPSPVSAVYTGLADFDDPVATVFRVDGALVLQDGPTESGNFANSLVRIGARSSFSSFFTGEISALTARFGPNLTGPIIRQMEQFTADLVAERAI